MKKHKWYPSLLLALVLLLANSIVACDEPMLGPTSAPPAETPPTTESPLEAPPEGAPQEEAPSPEETAIN